MRYSQWKVEMINKICIWEDAYLNERLLITTVIDEDCGNKLNELFDAIKIVVKVSLVVTEHGWASPATRQEDDTKFDVAIKLRDVINFNEDPAFVAKDGVTVNDMRLSPVFIQDILLGSPCVPVNSVIKESGIAAEFEVTVL